jgi:AcrR family transcriptional regulator
MASGSNRRGRPRDERLDTAIMDSALERFLEGGIAAASFETIAERAGVSRSTIYRRWRTREDLLLAALDRLRAEGERGAEDWASLPLKDVVAIFEERTVTAATDERSIGLLRQVLSLGEDSPIRRRYWSAVIEPRREAFAQMISMARRQGELSPGLDPHLLQDLLAGALTYRLLMNPEPLDESSARDYVHELLSQLGLLP